MAWFERACGSAFFKFGAESPGRGLQFCGVGRCTGGFVWPVHDGKIGETINRCVDIGGDGWGWHGEKSCLIDQTQYVCIDSDVDG